MSTRCTTHFTSGKKTPEAIIYRHSDGYPEGAGLDLLDFLQQCSKLKDSRLTDPSYLAAKYVVYLAGMFHEIAMEFPSVYGESDSPLNFLSVGVCQKDPTDIEYRYVVDCSKGRYAGLSPSKLREMVTCYSVEGGYGSPVTHKVVPIPPRPKDPKIIKAPKK